MEQLNISLLFPVVTCILAAVALGRAISLKKTNTLLARQLAETWKTLEATRENLETLREKQQKLTEFQNNLTGAELSTRIHTSRTTNSVGERPRATPERYGYVHSLANKGMSSEEIASVLTISTHEARQLVALAKIARGSCTTA